MNLQKAFQRLEWRFSKGNFTPNQNDADALQFLADWVNREKSDRLNQNRYFGKMVIYCLMREIDFFKDVKLAEKKLNEILELPIEYWYDRYRLQRVMRDFQDTMDVLNITHFTEVWDKHKDDKGYFDMEAIRTETAENDALMKENKDLLIQSLTRWKQKEINGILNLFITELLNEHGDKP